MRSSITSALRQYGKGGIVNETEGGTPREIGEGISGRGEEGEERDGWTNLGCFLHRAGARSHGTQRRNSRKPGGALRRHATERAALATFLHMDASTSPPPAPDVDELMRPEGCAIGTSLGKALRAAGRKS
jgi:hypothetical protein